MKEKILDINYAKVESYLESKRLPKALREKLDFGFKYEKNTFEIFEIRPVWNNPNDYRKSSFAKFRYIKTKKIWELCWMRASGKWESYKPFTESYCADKIIECIDTDTYGCCYG